MSPDPNSGGASHGGRWPAKGRASAGAGNGERSKDAESLDLVRRFQAGDRSAFAGLYRLWFDRLYGYANVALRDREDAEDATHDAFASALDSLPGFRPESGDAVSRWLFSMIRNAVINRGKRHRREQALVVQGFHDKEISEEIKAVEDPAAEAKLERVIARLDESELRTLFKCLPGPQREALAMRFWLDMSASQVAARMGRSVDDVEQLQSRGLRTLKAQLVKAGYRRERRSRRAPILKRIKPLPVLGARRFALGGSASSGPPRSPASARYRPASYQPRRHW